MNKAIPIIIAVVIVGGISVYAISPYSTESTVDEALPTGALIQPKIEDKESMKVDEIMMEESVKEEMKEVEHVMEDKMMMESEMKEKEVAIEEKLMMGERTFDESMMEEMIPMSYEGTFIGVGDGIHDAQGNAYTIPLDDGGNVLRLENFKSTNGPDLFVYLATDDNASEFVNLGELKANQGNQNYDIPEGTDLEKYNKVLIWCKAFSVLFGSAELTS